MNTISLKNQIVRYEVNSETNEPYFYDAEKDPNIKRMGLDGWKPVIIDGSQEKVIDRYGIGYGYYKFNPPTLDPKKAVEYFSNKQYDKAMGVFVYNKAKIPSDLNISVTRPDIRQKIDELAKSGFSIIAILALIALLK